MRPETLRFLSSRSFPRLDKSSPQSHDATAGNFSMIIERMNETVFAELHGELDIAYAGDLRDQLSFELISGKRVIIDLRRLEFLDITAVRTILEIDIQLRLTGGHLILIRGPKGTDRVFELMGLERRLDFVSLARSQPI